MRALVIAALLFVGCGGSGHDGERAPECGAPGERVACACGDAGIGDALCLDDRTLGPCICLSGEAPPRAPDTDSLPPASDELPLPPDAAVTPDAAAPVAPEGGPCRADTDCGPADRCYADPAGARACEPRDGPHFLDAQAVGPASDGRVLVTVRAEDGSYDFGTLSAELLERGRHLSEHRTSFRAYVSPFELQVVEQAPAGTAPDAVRLVLGDRAGHASVPYEARIAAPPVRAVGESCDPEGLQAVCAAGLVCAGGGYCDAHTPPTLRAGSARWNSVSGRAVLNVEGNAANPLRTLRIRPNGMGPFVEVGLYGGRGPFDEVIRWTVPGPAASLELRVVDELDLSSDPLVVPLERPPTVGRHAACDPEGADDVCADGLRCARMGSGTACRDARPLCDPGEPVPELRPDDTGGWVADADSDDVPLREPDAPCRDGADQPQARFAFVAPSAGTYRIQVDDGTLGWRTRLAVRLPCEGGAAPADAEIECTRPGGFPAASVPLAAGQRVELVVAAWGRFRVRAAPVAPPVVDHAELRLSPADPATATPARAAVFIRGHDPDADAVSADVELLGPDGATIDQWNGVAIYGAPDGRFSTATGAWRVASVPVEAQIIVRDGEGAETAVSVPVSARGAVGAGETCDPYGGSITCAGQLGCVDEIGPGPVCASVACAGPYDGAAIGRFQSEWNGSREEDEYFVEGDTRGAPPGAPSPCGGGAAARVYRFSMPWVGGGVTFSVGSPDGPGPVITVSGDPCPDGDDRLCGASGLDNPTAAVTVDLEPGQTVYVTVDGNGWAGPFLLRAE